MIKKTGFIQQEPEDVAEDGAAGEKTEDGEDNGGKLEPKTNQTVTITTRSTAKKHEAETDADPNAETNQKVTVTTRGAAKRSEARTNADTNAGTNQEDAETSRSITKKRKANTDADTNAGELEGELTKAKKRAPSKVASKKEKKP